MNYIPERYNNIKMKVKVYSHLHTYATKSNLKGTTDIDTSKFAKKFDLANLKTDVDKLDIDKVKTVPIELSNLSDVEKN